jgi:hypothetical protein
LFHAHCLTVTFGSVVFAASNLRHDSLSADDSNLNDMRAFDTRDVMARLEAERERARLRFPLFRSVTRFLQGRFVCVCCAPLLPSARRPRLSG